MTQKVGITKTRILGERDKRNTMDVENLDPNPGTREKKNIIAVRR